MDTDKNSMKAKHISKKYRFADLERLSKEELLIKYKELYNEFTALQCQSEIAFEKIQLFEAVKSVKQVEAKYKDYNPSTKGIEKVLYILKENRQVMLSKEILSEILLLEPLQTEEWRFPYSAVMKYISRAVKAKRIVKYKIDTIGYTYGLPEWFDENIKIKSKFLR